MSDQAEILRLLTNNGGAHSTKTIGVVSGKGGVGKSNFSLNFALSLCQRKQKVIVFDLDIGMGNIDILLGQLTERTIVDYFNGDYSLSEVITRTPYGVDIIAGGSGINQIFKLEESRKIAFLKDLQNVMKAYDYVVFDMGAGASQESLSFLLAVDDVFVVMNNEPTSLMDAYSMIKHVCHLDKELPFYLIANRVDTELDGVQAMNRLATTLTKFLDKSSNRLGTVLYDTAVEKAVRKQVPFVIDNPKSHASKSLERMAKVYEEHFCKKKQTEGVTKGNFVSKLKRFLFAS